MSSLFWATTCVPGFEYVSRLACWKGPLSFAHSVEGKFKMTFWWFTESVGPQNKDIVAASQTLLIWVRLLFTTKRQFYYLERFQICTLRNEPINDGKRLRKTLTFLQGESMTQLFAVEHLAVSKSSLAIQISWKYSFCRLNNQYKK